jgi:hypothetical protein
LFIHDRFIHQKLLPEKMENTEKL